MSCGSVQMRGAGSGASRGDWSQRTTAVRGYQSKSRTDLSVTTAEGDRITISLGAQQQYRSSSRGNSTNETASSAAELRVSVKGNLSDAEMADLGKLLASLAEGGGANGAANETFAGLTSLSAYSYRYQQSVEAGSLIRTRG